MNTVLIIHERLSVTVWLFFLLLGLWGLVRAIRGQGTGGSYLGAAVIGQGLFVAQAILGGLLWFAGNNAIQARPGLHLLYGIFALVFLPFVYLVWLRGDDSNQAQWVLAFATLFLFGIALRSIGTGV